MDGCSTFDGLINESSKHKPQYKNEYYELNDYEQFFLPVEQEWSIWVDPTGEDQWQENMHVKMGEHLKNCNDPTVLKFATLGVNIMNFQNMFDELF